MLKSERDSLKANIERLNGLIGSSNNSNSNELQILKNEKNTLKTTIDSLKAIIASSGQTNNSTRILTEKIVKLELENKKLLLELSILQQTIHANKSIGYSHNNPNNLNNPNNANNANNAHINNLESQLKILQQKNNELINQINKTKMNDTILIQKIKSLEQLNTSILKIKPTSTTCNSTCNCDKIMEQKNREISSLIYEIKSLKENCNNITTDNCNDVPQWAKSFY